MMKYLRMLILLTAVGFAACESFVDVDLPDSQLTGTTVFNDPNTANAAMTEIYSKMREEGFLHGRFEGSPILFGLYTDELVPFTGAGSQIVHSNSLLPSTSLVGSMWNRSYHQIYLANAVLEGVESATGLSVADKQQLRGEALFVRALEHFYLVNVYGDVPYIASTDYQQNRLAVRMAVNEVYAEIVADLEEAVTLLPQEYISADRTRPNQGTAYALLARTNLYGGLWAEAADAASAVINNPLYVWEDNLDNVFLRESTTTIWQLQPVSEGSNTYEASVFVFSSLPPTSVAIAAELVAAFEPGDLRKSHWLNAVTDGVATNYHANKYKESGFTATSVEYSILFRLAEQYLIRAEARAQQGDLSGARDDLDKVRNAAGLGDTDAVTASEIVDAVLRERRVELFTEYGHRFFDLKRTGRLDAELGPVKPGWDSTDRLWPIPEAEQLANPNLTPQNPGY